MSYSYSNPYASSATATRPAATHQTSGRNPRGYQLLFGGLPQDVQEAELKELISRDLSENNPPYVKFLYNSTGAFFGLAIVQVNNEFDAERLRSTYSGQTIDATARMTVQHILDPDRPYPLDSPQVQPFVPTPPPAAATAAAAPTAKQPPSGPKGKQAAQAAAPQGSKAAKGGPAAPTSATPSGKPPGLKLLARMSKPGQAGVPGPKTQAGLIAAQKANLARRSAGAALLSRLDKPHSPVTAVKTKVGAKGKGAAAPVAKGAAAKVQRAKAGANKMEVDKPVVAPKKAKTQQELDEEMRLYERGRRFAGAA